MQISTPDQPQKACSYCSTPAEPRAVKCQNCGSALPLALPASVPRPVARMVEAQSKWSMGKTALVSAIVSLALGAFINTDTAYLVLVSLMTVFWFTFLLPQCW